MEFKSHEDQMAFEEWAFGYTPVRYAYSSMLEWNSRHGDKYMVKADETIQDSVSKMYELFEKE
jgi:hypothetical protein